MNEQDQSMESVRRDAAVAAAALIIEELFPHCPNGLVAPIGERLCEIVESAIDAAAVYIRAGKHNRPSLN